MGIAQWLTSYAAEEKTPHIAQVYQDYEKHTSATL
jgi:hypothetical protein